MSSLFRQQDFVRLWFIGLLVSVVRWLETLAVGVFVYQTTQSAFLVAMLTMLRVLPLGLFGALFGALAEHVDRRTALIVIELHMMLISVVVALLALAGQLALWHIAVASFLSGVAWATDNPVRRMMIGEVVGPALMGRAMSADVASNNASRMLGPVVGGVVLAVVGMGGAFALSAVLYLFAVVAALRLAYRAAPAPSGSKAVFARMVEGFACVRQSPTLIGALAVTIIFNVFGWPITSMVPVLALDNLHVGPAGIGVLASMEGVGALCGALAVAVFGRPSYYLRVYVGGVLVYLLMVIVFALVSSPMVAGAALLLAGFGSAGFSVMQATLVYVNAPVEMRGRVLGILALCIGTGPIGFIGMGLAAEAFGSTAATVGMGLTGVAVLAFTQRWWRAIEA